MLNEKNINLTFVLLTHFCLLPTFLCVLKKKKMNLKYIFLNLNRCIRFKYYMKLMKSHGNGFNSFYQYLRQLRKSYLLPVALRLSIDNLFET